MKLEKKELVIFLIFAFGIPCFVIVPMAILRDAGKDISVFAFAQIFYLASGFMRAKILCEKDRKLLPKRLLLCFTSFFIPSNIVFDRHVRVTGLGSIILTIFIIR